MTASKFEQYPNLRDENDIDEDQLRGAAKLALAKLQSFLNTP